MRDDILFYLICAVLFLSFVFFGGHILIWLERGGLP